MKTNSNVSRLLCCCVYLLAGIAAQAAVGFSVSPAATSNTYTGVITLQATGLTNGEAVVVQRFLDSNADGVPGAGEPLMTSYNLADGGVSTIAGITNLNVPFDSNSTTGAITTALNFTVPLENITGQHLYRLFSPTGRFAPLTAALNVTNAALAQSAIGTVYASGSPQPYAMVVALTYPGFHYVGAVVADNAGNYLLKLVPGTYALLPTAPNYYVDQATLPVIVLTNGMATTNNLFLTNGTVTISGKVMDATNSTGLGGVFMQLESGSLFTIAFTDTNGNYSATVTPSFWTVSTGNDDGMGRRGYVVPNSSPQVDTTTGSVANVNFSLPPVNALIYGRITNSLGAPLPNIAFSAHDGNGNDGVFEAKGYGNADGYYAVGVLGETNAWHCSPSDQSAGVLTNYVVSSGTQTVLAAGQVSRQDFSALLATAHISGHLQDNAGNPVGQIYLYANASIGGINYSTSGDTDGAGNYTMSAASGTWYVGVNCCGNEGLDNFGLVDLAGQHPVTVPPTNAVVNITVYPVGTPTLDLPVRQSPTQVGLTVHGALNANYTMQASTNLALTNWQSLFSFQLTTNPFPVVDTQATNAQRYYRVRKN